MPLTECPIKVLPVVLAIAMVVGAVWMPGSAQAQQSRVVQALRTDFEAATSLEVDRGASALLQELRRAASTASLLHITGHPDDEHAGMLTLESRGRGTRVALASLNRGEGGANALGPELFDALGVIRTEELLLAGRWYGLDDLYFTTAVDYGFSKTIDEAYRSWDREAVLEDLVRIVRLNRPMVVVSRWHGSLRDGHGHHQAAGDLSLDAVLAAADPNRFPDQLTHEGLEPWRALRVFRGGVREGESTHVVVDANVYAPELGRTYQEAASYGLSLQRSQTSGRIRRSPQRRVYRYEWVNADSVPTSPSPSFFSGMDTSFGNLPALLNEGVDDAVVRELERLDSVLDEAYSLAQAGQLDRTADAVTMAIALVDTLRGDLQRLAPESARILANQRATLVRALAQAAGIRFGATARGVDGAAITRVAAGDEFLVEVDAEARLDPSAKLSITEVELIVPRDWDSRSTSEGVSTGRTRQPSTFRVAVAPIAAPTYPQYTRSDLRANHYTVLDSVALSRPWPEPPVRVRAHFERSGVDFSLESAVRGIESALPYGETRRVLGVAPPVLVDVPNPVHVVRADRATEPFTVPFTVRQGGLSPTRGAVRLDLPNGWTSNHAGGVGPLEFATEEPGETAAFSVTVTPVEAPRGAPDQNPNANGPGLDRVRLAAVRFGVGAAPRYTSGEHTISYPDLDPRYIPRPAEIDVRVVDAVVPDGLRVGYVMGVGDAVPDALEALDVAVDLLDADALAGGDLSVYDAVFIGTRAYAVRPELVTHNLKLLDYVRGGGHLVVLYQTPEYDPGALLPFVVELPGNAEETSEEDAVVHLLEPEHQLLAWPNPLREADFDGWIEQRGSKFFSRWGPQLTPLLETADEGQDPQRGVWLTADVGSGAFTYCALALHRQTPYGIEGAYRILANLASLSQSAR